MRKVEACLVALIVVAAAGAARADDDTIDPTVISLIGYEQSLSKGGIATLVITCDETKVITAMPVLQEMDLINRDLNETFINSHHLALAGTVAIAATTLALMVAYQNEPSLDVLRVQTQIAATDDYGNTTTRPAFSFGFDRATYKRINWKNFDDRKLPNVTKRFVMSPWYHAALANEFN